MFKELKSCENMLICCTVYDRILFIREIFGLLGSALTNCCAIKKMLLKEVLLYKLNNYLVILYIKAYFEL